MRIRHTLKVLVVIAIIFVNNGNIFSQVLTNVYVKKNDDLTKVLSRENRRFIIGDNVSLKGNTVTIGSNSILDFQGGSVSNGVINGNNTLVLGAPYCVFDKIELTGSFKGESYPEWFNGDVQKCIDHFKVIRFVNEEYVLTDPLDLHFGTKLHGESFNVLKFKLSSDYYGKGCINVAAFCEVSNFIIYVESDNPAIEIKSSYVSSSISNSDYMQRIAPETTSPGSGYSASVHIHDMTIRTGLKENYGDKNSTVNSTTPAIWLAGGGGYVAYDRDAHMYRIIKAPGMWGLKFDNIDISGRWLVGIKCEQINEGVTDEEITELERLINKHEPDYHYWESYNNGILKNLKRDKKWGYGWITGCVFDNIRIHTVLGGIWLGREHITDGRVISRGASIQHFMFSNVQMQYWQRDNRDNTINISSKYFVKLNNRNGITFTNCEPWDWPITNKSVEKPFQIDDSYNVWNITFQGYSQWHNTNTNFIQYENGSKLPLCNEHRVVLSIPESSFGMGNIAVLDDYIDYTNYNENTPESMCCNKQLRLLPPGTYSIPNINQRILKDFFKIKIDNINAFNQTITDAWIDVKLIADASYSIGTQYKRIITIHFYVGAILYQMTLRNDDSIDRPLKVSDWSDNI